MSRPTNPPTARELGKLEKANAAFNDIGNNSPGLGPHIDCCGSRPGRGWTHADCGTDSHGHAYGRADTHCDADRGADAYGHTYGGADSHSNADCGANADCDADRGALGNAHCGADADCNADRGALDYADCGTDADCNADRGALGYAHCGADADCNAYTDTRERMSVCAS